MSSKKLFSFWRCLNLSFEFFGHVGKQLDNKAKIDLKIYNVTYWERNDYNMHTAQKVK